VADATYDVFVSYSRAERPPRGGHRFHTALEGSGHSLIGAVFAPGLPWLRALEQVIGSAKAAIVLIGPRGLGNTQQYERDLALIRQTRDPAFPVVPVILPETTSDPR
jgi:TIR domain